MSSGGSASLLPDKVDMSLDEIIRLNKKEQQLRTRQRRPGKKKKGRAFPPRTARQTPGAGGGTARGGAPKLRNRRVPPFRGRRRAQGVVAGLVARRPTGLLKRAAPLNRATVKQRPRQRRRGFLQRVEAPFRKSEVQNAAPLSTPFQRRPRPPPPAVQQTQKEARQATFLFRRGLKVQAQMEKSNPSSSPLKSPQWRSSAAATSSSSISDGSGILTVSIDNPTARTQPEPPSAWTLHPPAVSPTPPLKVETVKKIPKGVALQFDINSVGKPQTSMTLNERFRILKDQRSAVAQSSKGGRFVTVG